MSSEPGESQSGSSVEPTATAKDWRSLIQSLKTVRYEIVVSHDMTLPGR